MILNYDGHKQISLASQGMTIIGTSSTIAYRDLIKGLVNNIEYVKLADDNYDNLPVEKDVDFVGDIMLSYKVLDKYLPNLLKYYLTYMNTEEREAINLLYNKLLTNLDNVIIDNDLPLSLDFEIDFKKILKGAGISITPEILSDPYDIIETILKIHSMCHMQKIIVLTNVAHYVEREQLTEINRVAKLMNLPVVLIEFTEKDFQVVPENVDFYYIDQDLVDWY